MGKLGYTLKDVAERAGVSLTTVSRVINKRGYFSEKTESRIYTAMQEMNYHPNSVARSLSGKRTKLIGVILTDTRNPFNAQLLEKIESELFNREYKVILANSSDNPQKERSYIGMLQSNQVDGLITASHNTIIEDYQQLNLPVVSLDRYFGPNIPTISSDNFSGGQTAARVLLAGGAKKLLVFSGEIHDTNPTVDRTNGFMDIAKKHQLTPAIQMMPSDATVNFRKMLIHQEILKQKPDGIMATDDTTALLVLEELRMMHLRVPQDVQVVGYDGSDFIRESFPTLSTVVQPISDLAKTLVDTLIRKIEQPDLAQERQYTFPITFHRGTTTKNA